ncbi:MAG: hypothetical protein K8R69_06495 [Deltaproteobacteria bacterium]|nr:hypothetical protein [Deltaproteobacteria bacterium]
MQRKKGGCCGCGCFSGCLVLLLLIVGMVVGFWYFVIHNASYVQQSDTVIVWAYRNVARPKMIEMFAAGMNEQERSHFLQMTDGAIDKYVALPADEKQAILAESTTALWYLWSEQMLPPEKIPHLQKFAEDLQKGWAPTPQQIQDYQRRNPQAPLPEAPRPNLPEPKPAPRLLN